MNLKIAILILVAICNLPLFAGDNPELEKRIEVVRKMGKDVPALTKALEADHYMVREAAANELAKIGPEAAEAIPVLQKILTVPPPKANQNRKYYFHVCEAGWNALRKVDPKGSSEFRRNLTGICKAIVQH